jgi:hypothetical protein
MRKQSAKLALIFLFVFQIARADVIINEVCWMGDKNSSSNEWIELYNNSSENISLNNWKIIISNEKIITLNGLVPSQGFYLLSRNKNQIEANLYYNKALNNNGEKLELANEKNIIVDLIDCSDGWPYGNNETKQTMERINQKWQTSLNPEGTPKKQNTVIEKEVLQNSNNLNKNNYNSLFPLLISLIFGGIIVFIKKNL